MFSGMTLAAFPELIKLPKRQKLRLAEELWFAGADDKLPIHSVHKQILDERWTAYQAGKSVRISRHELERRLARK